MFSSSFKGGKNTDVLKVALKCGNTASRNSKEFADKSKNHSNLDNLTHPAGLESMLIAVVSAAAQGSCG